MEHTELRTSRIFKVTKTVVFGDLTGGGATEDVAFDAALPADAAIVGFGLDVTAAFANLAGTVGGSLGTTVLPTIFLNGTAVDLSIGVGKVHAPAGIGPVGLVGAITPSIRFAASVGTTGTMTAGSVTAEIYFIRTAEQA